MTIKQELLRIEMACRSPRDVALLRMDYLANDGVGLPAKFTAILVESFLSFEDQVSSWDRRNSLLSEKESTITLQKVLQTHLSLSRLDATLAEELGRQGSHSVLVKVLSLPLDEPSIDTDESLREDYEDAVVALQDIAGEIASLGAFPLKTHPLEAVELRQRLPLVFTVEPVNVKINPDPLQSECDSLHDVCELSEKIFIHQVTSRQSAQDDVGFVMWPSAVVLSRWIATFPSVLKDKRVLELGAGCGLVGLLAARLQKHIIRTEISMGAEATDCAALSPVVPQVALTDFNPVVLKNLERNVDLNDVPDICEVIGLDFYMQTGLPGNQKWISTNGHFMEQVDLVLAADIICRPEDALAAAKTLHDVLRPGGTAFIVCASASHRFGVDRLESSCKEIGLQVECQDVGKLLDGQLYNDDLEKTTGYVSEMTLNMFVVSKAIVQTIHGSLSVL